MKKNNQKCIRMTDEVLQYVESFEGNGFNEKFENLVFFCMKHEQQKRNMLETLERRIDVYHNLSDISFRMRTLQQELDHFQQFFSSVENRCEQIEGKLRDVDNSLNME